MILILGQGLAGTMLAWELERAGMEFAIVDHGHAAAASAAAAGIINPVTGRRLVRSWRIEALLPLARETYRAIEAELGVRVWHEARVRRLFADDRERTVFAAKRARGDFEPFVGEADGEGFWVDGAARVDVAALLAAARARWLRVGQLRETAATAAPGGDLEIDCRGAGGVGRPEFGFVPWEFSQGETLELAVGGLSPDVILNCRHWIAATAPGVARVGATHEPGGRTAMVSAGARAALEASARRLLGDRPFAVREQRAGIRVNLPDRRPIAGRHPRQAQLGLMNGLAAKGALWAPWLARQWREHLTTGAPFDAAIEVRRFWRG